MMMVLYKLYLYLTSNKKLYKRARQTRLVTGLFFISVESKIGENVKDN